MLGALLLAGAIAHAAALDARHWQEGYRAAQAAAREYDSGQALAHYREALREAEQFGESDPRLLQTLAQLALICADEDVGDSKEGEAYLARALKIRPKTTGAAGANAVPQHESNTESHSVCCAAGRVGWVLSYQRSSTAFSSARFTGLAI